MHGLHVGAVCLAEGRAPVALRHEVEVARARRGHDGLDRFRAGVRDGAGRQPLVLVGVVGIRGVRDHVVRDLAGVARAGGRLLRGDEAAVARRRIALQDLGRERGIAQPVEKDARDDGPILVHACLLLDHRRQRDDLSRAPAERAREIEQAGLVSVLERRVPPVELGLQPAHDVRGIAIHRELVGRREEEALGAGSFHVEVREQGGVGRPVEEGAQRADVQGLEAARDVEARPALGDRDLRATRGGAPLEKVHELLRREIVGDEVRAPDDARRPARRPQIEREEARAVRETGGLEARREGLRGLVPRYDQLDVAPRSRAPRAREVDEEDGAAEDDEERHDPQRDLGEPCALARRRLPRLRTDGR